jgi:hypothetical protein
MTNVELPQVSKKCKVCTSENKFLIQKAVDNGASIASIAREYDISISSINNHITNNHRSNLLMLGEIDYVLRRKSIDVGLTLADYLEKWKSVIVERSGNTIKDSDALKAMELYAKVEGGLVNKHEVTVKKSIREIFNEILDCDEEDKTNNEEEEDETKYNEEKEGKNEEIEILETVKS